MEKIRICPTCNQEVKVNTGMHNWKNLFRKPSLEDFITLFIILAVIALFFAYKHDIEQYTTYINTNCKPNQNSMLNPNLKVNSENYVPYVPYLNQTNNTTTLNRTDGKI